MLRQSMDISSAGMQPAPAAAELRVAGRGGAAIIRHPWLILLCASLLGYALVGRGFAYLGYPPIYVGEMILVIGVLWFIDRGRWAHLDTPCVWLLVLLAGWGMLRTWPYVPVYGIDALRDAAIFGYSAFAVIVLAYIRLHPAALGLLLRQYRVFAWVFLLGIPFVWSARYVFAGVMPRWAWADVPIIEAKAGDVLVHVSGILAFWVAGFGGSIGWFRVLLLGLCAAVIGAYERAGMLAFGGCFLICLMLRPQDRLLHRLIGMAFCGLVFLAASGIRFEVPTPDTAKAREVSIEYVLANVRSVVGDTDVGDLDDTKQWRLQWWDDILDYTVRGEYFWTGKGFGINLADDDGFQVMADRSLRSPHNGHLTMLARAGVPGFGIWAIVQLAWAWAIVRQYVRSYRAGDARWSGLFLFLLVYWVAFMVNTGFDVFIEGPMGGIWFWTIYGFGLGSVWLSKHRPEVLCEAQDPDCA